MLFHTNTARHKRLSRSHEELKKTHAKQDNSVMLKNTKQRDHNHAQPHGGYTMHKKERTNHIPVICVYILCLLLFHQAQACTQISLTLEHNDEVVTDAGNYSEKTQKEAKPETSETDINKDLPPEHPPAESKKEEVIQEQRPEELTKETIPERQTERTTDDPSEHVVELHPDTPSSSPIGSPCQNDADCGGQPYICIAEMSGTVPFPFPNPTGKGSPGGYCTQPCYVGGKECPPDSTCYVPGAASGMCLKSCSSTQECRRPEGYVCMESYPKKACFPPSCTLSSPTGTYNITLGPFTRLNGCTGTAPVPSGTTLTAQISKTGSNLRIVFGAKPGSMLPVTWPLEGTYQTSGKFDVGNPKGCSSGCDGKASGYFRNACTFSGTLEMTHGNCTFSYQINGHHR